MWYKISAVRLLVFLLLPFPLAAQFTYRVAHDIPVEKDGAALVNPWAGGLNSPQVNKMDLDGDSVEDLVIFDKATAQIKTFLRVNGVYRHAPEYETLFPAGLSTFVSLRDFDCDEKKDLFTFGQIGVFVYKQVAVTGKPFGWNKMSFPIFASGLTSEVLMTKGFNQINLLPGTNDLPDFSDVDGDGDLDVINMRFVNPNTAEFHKNFSVENHGECNLDSLARMTSNWGGFEECSCGLIAFAPQDCADIGGRSMHNGGKAMLSLDTDGDGDRDLLFTEESCTSLYRLENTGTTESAVMSSLSFFPPGVTIPHYPAPYLEDIDGDGAKDLLIGNNSGVRTHTFTDFANSLWYYRNTGTDLSPVFEPQQPNFLQDQMIEVGDQATPHFSDLDRDGDLDMLVGTFLNSQDSRASLTLYENTGNSSQPSFKWITNDYAYLLYASLYNIRPQIADINTDGTPDLVFTATSGGNTRLFTLLAPPGGQPAFDGENLVLIDLPLTSTDNARLHDIDNDGLLDVLVGKINGSLYYYRATAHFPNPTYQLVDAEFLGLGISTSRQNLSADIGDLDGDGNPDLVTGDQLGTIMIFSDFLSSNPEMVDSLVLDDFSGTYLHRNLGGSARPAIANLLGVNRPSIVVGNRQGGLQLLHHDNSVPLSEAPQVSLSPNPVAEGTNLTILSDRSVTIEIYNMLGARLGLPQVIHGGQSVLYPLHGISAGLYIARFTAGSKATSVRFVVY